MCSRFGAYHRSVRNRMISCLDSSRVDQQARFGISGYIIIQFIMLTPNELRHDVDLFYGRTHTYTIGDVLLHGSFS